MPASSVIPVLSYPDVGQAIDWLCDVFGFTLRWRIGTHRAQLNVGEGAVAITEQQPEGSPRGRGDDGISVMVRVADVDGHHQHARQRGARILEPPTDYPYGERQYTVEDLGGHTWTFSQSIADVVPEEWGGTSASL
jgi:uncharacterized glyoxalase superfamily protein PhnB